MGSAVIGALRVNIFADSAEFKRGLTEAERMAERFGRAIGSTLKTGFLAAGAAATAATVALVALTKSSMDTISTQVDLAKRVGASVGAIQTLQFAAEQAGASQEGLAKMLGMLNVQLGKAAREGAGPAYEALQRLGLSARELSELDADERIKALSDRMKELGYTTQQQADTLKSFGVRQLELVNLFQEGSEAIDQARQDLIAWGVLLSDVDAQKVEMAGDALEKIGVVLTGIGNQIAIRVAPLLQAVADYLTDAAKESKGFGSVIDRVIEFAIRLFAALNRELYTFRVTMDGAIADVLNLWDAIAGAPANILAKVFGGAAEDYGFKPINESFGNLKNELAKPPSDEEWLAWFEEKKRQANEAAAAVANVTGGTGTDEDDEATQKRRQKQEEELTEFRDNLAQKLTALQESLLTEREAELANYEQRLMDLENFHNLGMLSDDEYRSALLKSQERHAEAIKEIDDDIARNNERNAKKQMDTYFDIADNIQSALSSLFGDSKAWAIAEAIINTATAITKALAVYGPTPQGFAAAAAAAAAGAAQLAAIRKQSSSSKGGGSNPSVRSTGSREGSNQSQNSNNQSSALQQTLFVRGLSNDALLSGEMVRAFAKKLIEYQRDGGKIVLGPA